jgi:hypothetical protein
MINQFTLLISEIGNRQFLNIFSHHIVQLNHSVFKQSKKKLSVRHFLNLGQFNKFYRNLLFHEIR